MTITVAIPPAVEALSLADVKAHLRVLHTSEDAYIASLITVARQHLEGHGAQSGRLGRTIAAQSLVLSRPDFAGAVVLSRGPVTAVTSIAYTDSEGAAATLTPSAVTLTADDDRTTLTPVTGTTWPVGATDVRITYTAGYDASGLPAPLRHAMLLLIQHWYDQRSAVGERMDALPFAVEALIAPYQTHGWI